MIGKGQQLARSYDINLKVAQVLQRRVKVAQEHFTERVRAAWEKEAAASLSQPRLPPDWKDGQANQK